MSTRDGIAVASLDELVDRRSFGGESTDVRMGDGLAKFHFGVRNRSAWVKSVVLLLWFTIRRHCLPDVTSEARRDHENESQDIAIGWSKESRTRDDPSEPNEEGASTRRPV